MDAEVAERGCGTEFIRSDNGPELIAQCMQEYWPNWELPLLKDHLGEDQETPFNCDCHCAIRSPEILASSGRFFGEPFRGSPWLIWSVRLSYKDIRRSRYCHFGLALLKEFASGVRARLNIASGSTLL